MRVLTVSPHYPPRVGGVETYAREVAGGLHRQFGDDVTVVTTGEGRRVRRRRDGGLLVIELPVLTTVSNTPLHPAWPRQLRALMRELDPDVVHTHAPVVGLADVATWVRGDRPLVATYHAGSMRKGALLADTTVGAYERVVLRRVLAAADAVVAIHPTFVPALIGSSDRVSSIPPGVDLSVFNPGPGPAQDPAPPVVLYVGRLERSSAWKGVGTLLRAFVDVPSARLRLVGAGDAVDDHRALAARLGIADRVELPGPRFGAELAAEYRAATLVVLPSESDAESFGMVLIEALACGTPVVGSRIGGIPRVVAETGGGVLVEPGDAGRLAEGIDGLLRDPVLRRRLAADGQAAVTADFTWEAAVRRYHELFVSLPRAGR